MIVKGIKQRIFNNPPVRRGKLYIRRKLWLITNQQCLRRMASKVFLQQDARRILLIAEAAKGPSNAMGQGSEVRN